MMTWTAGALRRWPVLTFFLLAYLFSWSWWLPLAACGSLVRGGEPWPTHMPGLLGPLLAAMIVTAAVDGRPGLTAFLRRVVSWRMGWRRGLLALSPLAMLVVGLAVARLIGSPTPPWTDLFVISGLPIAVLPTLAALLVLNGLGEEGGWRGFAQERLQWRYGPTRAAMLTALAWAGWHAPLFAVLVSFRDFSLATLPGYFLGMFAGAVVLAYVYNAAGGSIAAAACWHVAYNLASASAAAAGTVAAVSTTIVMAWAGFLLIGTYQASRRGAVSPLLAGRSRPRPGSRARAVV